MALGVYLASNGMMSSGYCGVAQSCWRNSASGIASCVALTEVVNLPSKFVYNREHFVVDKTDWIIWCVHSRPTLACAGIDDFPSRYLLVMGWSDWSPNVTLNYFQMIDQGPQVAPEQDADDSIPYVKMDPTYPPMMGVQRIRIPEPTHALEKILAARREEFFPVNYNEDDLAIFNAVPPIQAMHPAGEVGVVSIESDWQHDREWVLKAIEHIAPPPTESSIQATAALQRELKALLQEQKTAKSLKELGWYIPMDLISDNLYQWIVELHSFNKDLPIAKEMDQRCVIC